MSELIPKIKPSDKTNITSIIPNIMVDRVLPYACNCGSVKHMLIDVKLCNDSFGWQPVPFMIKCPYCNDVMYSAGCLLSIPLKVVNDNDDYFEYNNSDGIRVHGIKHFGKGNRKLKKGTKQNEY